jgi:hypothetical protein
MNMNKTGIGIDYSNICKNYNTSYLDRDNKDPDTSKCMKAVVAWTHGFLSELCEHFGYEIFRLNSSVPVTLEEVASNRFLFFSLEKGITLQSYVIQKEYVEYDALSTWGQQSDGILIQNDEDGEGVYLYLVKESDAYRWIKEKLEEFSLDELPFQAK